MHYPINIEMLMGMAQTAGISDLSKKLLGQMARALNIRWVWSIQPRILFSRPKS